MTDVVIRLCPDCSGAGRVRVAVVRQSDYSVTGWRSEACMGCLGTGRVKRLAQVHYRYDREACEPEFDGRL